MHPALFIMASETEYFKVSNKFDIFKGFVPLIRFFNMTIQALLNYNFAPFCNRALCGLNMERPSKIYCLKILPADYPGTAYKYHGM
jgi:hypothetical protein